MTLGVPSESVGLTVTVFVAGADVTGAGAESVIVTDTDSGVCTDTVGEIVHVDVVDAQPVHE